MISSFINKRNTLCYPIFPISLKRCTCWFTSQHPLGDQEYIFFEKSKDYASCFKTCYLYFETSHVYVYVSKLDYVFKFLLVCMLCFETSILFWFKTKVFEYLYFETCIVHFETSVISKIKYKEILKYAVWGNFVLYLKAIQSLYSIFVKANSNLKSKIIAIVVGEKSFV